jgi:periplasmic protein TonB
MKQFFLLFLLFFTVKMTLAQNIDTTQKIMALDPSDDNIVFTKTEIDAKFPGGDSAWFTYLGNNLKYDTPINNGAPKGNYKVMIRFIVSRDGSITDVVSETNYGFGMELEAIKIIKNSPSWIPAMQNGRIVNSYRRQPLTFVVE